MRVLLVAIMSSAALLAADSQDLTQAQADDVIQKFAAKEAAFARARENYAYRQTARIQTSTRAEIRPDGGSRSRTSSFQRTGSVRSAWCALPWTRCAT